MPYVLVLAMFGWGLLELSCPQHGDGTLLEALIHAEFCAARIWFAGTLCGGTLHALSKWKSE